MSYLTDTPSKALLGVGFVELALGVAAAYVDPASGYELSIYTGTSRAFWIGVGFAVLVAITTSLFAPRARQRVVGLLLGGGCFTAFVGLPVLRNYHFYGTADALTHLGWARGLASGETELLSMLYPGIHTATAFIEQLTGYSSARSMLYVVVLFAVLFLIFSGLCAWTLTGDLRTTAIATFSASMLLPITNISSQLVAHTTTQAIMFLPVVLYLLIRYLQTDGTGLRPTGVGLLLATTLVALVLYHPQQSLNLLLMFVAIAVLQAVVRRWSRPFLTASTRPVYTPTGVLALAFAVWVPGKERFEGSASRGLERIRAVLAGDASIGTETVQRSGSLTELGSGLLEIYLKLFGVTTVYCLIAGGLLLGVLAGRLDLEERRLSAFSRLQIVGLVPVAGLFLVYVVGRFEEQSFRHVAFIMVFVTLFGAIGIAIGSSFLAERLPGAAAGLPVVLFVGLAVSAAVVFPSPYIFLHSQHVTEAQMNGHEASFEHIDRDAPFLGVRRGPDRYADVYNGGLVEDDTRFGAISEAAMLSDLSRAYGDDWYFTLTTLDYEQETGAYRELRYSRTSFDAARTQRGVNRVGDNGEVELYYVTG